MKQMGMKQQQLRAGNRRCAPSGERCGARRARVPPPALSQACCCVRCELTCAAYACALRPTSNRRAVRVQAKTGEDHKGKWRALDVDESDDQQVRCWLASLCSETANLPML